MYTFRCRMQAYCSFSRGCAGHQLQVFPTRDLRVAHGRMRLRSAVLALGRLCVSRVQTISGMSVTTASTSLASQLRHVADALDAWDGRPAIELAEQLSRIAAEVRGLQTTAAGPLQHTLHHHTQQQPVDVTRQRQPQPSASPESLEGPVEQSEPATKKQRRGDRTFDINRFQRRHVALHVAYVGWQYHGLARQLDTDQTIEAQLLFALRRTRLIGETEDYSDVAYSRCGRTDKGVSALAQVVALQLRSAGRAGAPPVEVQSELDYPTLLNRVLPPDIRVLGWAPATPEFNARFDALHREYKYFILQDGSLDLAAMQQAADYLVGHHDFRNFCKADVAQVRNFMRHMLEVTLQPTDVAAGSMRVYALYLKGTAFLWHQVRCIAAVLLMVGRGLEKPEVVQQLLDMTANPAKPQYSMASEDPLLLFGCEFDGLDWQRSEASVQRNLTDLHAMIQQHLIAAALTSAMFQQVLQYRSQQAGRGAGPADSDPAAEAAAAALQWQPPAPAHMPLARRAREPTMEVRFAKAGISMDLLNMTGLQQRTAAAAAVAAVLTDTAAEQSHAEVAKERELALV